MVDDIRKSFLLAFRYSPDSGGLSLVLKAVEPIWIMKTETANRVRGRIESVLDWATARGHRQGENPRRWHGHLENLLSARSKVRLVDHHAALHYCETGAFVADLLKQGNIDAHALEFAVLTAARTTEVLGAKWDELNMAEKLWAVPPQRINAGKEHRVPLSDPALAILEKMEGARQSDHVVPGTKAEKPISNIAVLMTLRRIQRCQLTVHGFRSTFRDWAAEYRNFPAEVAEMALVHTIGDKVEAACRRSDSFQKHREFIIAWMNYIDHNRTQVVRMRRGKT